MADSSKESEIYGGRRQPLGRSALLLHASNNIVKPGIGVGQYYRPASVDDSLPNATPAIPGECVVQDSWQYLSCAPVAYQMQQVLSAKEDSYEERKEDEQPQIGAMSLEDAHLPLTKQKCNPSVDFKKQCKQKPHGSRIDTTYALKAEGKEQVSGRHTKDDCSKPLWEPFILDKDRLQVPDLTSNVDFPELVHSKAAVRKKM